MLHKEELGGIPRSSVFDLGLRVGGVASGPAWKAERRLSVVLVLATWVAEPATSLWRDLGVGVWRLVLPVEVLELVPGESLVSCGVAGANDVDALGRRSLLEGVVAVKP